MKKAIVSVLTLVFLLLTSKLNIQATEITSININGNNVIYTEESGQPFIDDDNRTQVPFRVTLEEFGATVTWNKETLTATAEKNGIIVQVPIGKDYILKNGVTISVDTEAIIKNGRTYLPIRPVLEALGAVVTWNSEDRQVLVTTEISDGIGEINTSTNNSLEPSEPEEPTVPPPTIKFGVIDSSIPIPDQANAILRVGNNDPSIVTTKTLISQLPEGSKKTFEYNFSRAVQYNGSLYYTIKSVCELIDMWNDTNDLPIYEFSYSTIFATGSTKGVIYLDVFKGGSVSARGAILVQEYAKEGDLLMYGGYGYINYDTLKEMLEKTGMKASD